MGKRERNRYKFGRESIKLQLQLRKRVNDRTIKGIRRRDTDRAIGIRQRDC